MSLREDYMKPLALGHPRSQLDIRTAAGHVGGDRNPSILTRSRNDLRLLPIKPGIQDLMLQPCLCQKSAEVFRSGDRSRAHQDRPPLGV